MDIILEKSGNNYSELGCKEIIKVGSTIRIGSMSRPTADVLVDERLYNMLFSGVGSEEGGFYWLATRMLSESIWSHGCDVSVVIDKWEGVPEVGVTYSGLGLCYTSDGGRETQGYGAIRPVINLKSSVTSSEIQRIPDKIEEKWNYSIDN